jgi:L-rhamnose-H+ transport protein
LSGLCNGLFSAPMKLEARWKWENIWFGFIVVACWLMPVVMVKSSGTHISKVLSHSPQSALTAALLFGFLWGFGAICFGRSVERLGVSVANTLVIGLSSALGSLVPLVISANFRMGVKELLLLTGIAIFLLGAYLSGRGGALRDASSGAQHISSDTASSGSKLQLGYLFAVGSGVMSAIFNIGYSMALPISDSGVALGYSRFAATNCIWLLMLGMGALPNLAYCLFLMRRNQTFPLMIAPGAGKSWALSAVMGLLWGGSIFLYGAATPLLGDLGPSVGWPLSLAVGLIVANVMGVLLGEWRNAPPQSVTCMRSGFALLLLAIVFCAYSARMSV